VGPHFLAYHHFCDIGSLIPIRGNAHSIRSLAQVVANSEQECESRGELPRARLETAGQANLETHLVNCHRQRLRNPDLLVGSGAGNHAADILLRSPTDFPDLSNCKPFSLLGSCSIIAIRFIVAVFGIIRGGHI